MAKLMLLAFLLISIPVMAATKTSNHEGINLLQKKLDSENRSLQLLNGKISKIEKDLQRNNKRFVRVVGKRNEIEVITHRLERNIRSEREQLEKEKKQSERIIRGLLLARIGGKQTAVEIISNDLMMKMLKKRIVRINKGLDTNEELTSRLDKLKAEHDDFQRDELNILSQLHQLERDKQKYAHQYVGHVENIENLKKRLTYRKTNFRKIYSQSNEEKKYQCPLKKFIQVDDKEKDMKFVFKGEQPVFAPREGKVIEIAKVSVYWDVGLMIDHGNQDISLLYGSFSPSVKKGAVVRKGDVIGYTNPLYKTIGELNFGIRKGVKIRKASRFINIKKQTTL